VGIEFLNVINISFVLWGYGVFIFCGLFIFAVGSWFHMASNFRVIDEFRKNQKGSGCGLIWGTAPTICLEELRTPAKSFGIIVISAKIRTGNFPDASQNMTWLAAAPWKLIREKFLLNWRPHCKIILLYILKYRYLKFSTDAQSFSSASHSNS